MSWTETSWRERILNARARGFFTAEEKNKAYSHWTTCAVGEQVEKYGEAIAFRFTVNSGAKPGAPKDEDLFDLGDMFGRAVMADAFDRAETLLAQIEDRAQELKTAWISPSS